MMSMETINDDKKSYSLFAQNIVKTLGRKIFAANKALFCLSKSDTFFKELTNLFNKLFYFDITPETFYIVIENLECSSKDKERLKLCAKIYVNYIELMKKNSFKIPVYKQIKNNQQPFEQNENIKTCIKNLNTKYLEFCDIQSESIFIINEMKNAVNNKNACWNDFAVFVDKTEARQKFLNIMKTNLIPVVSSIYNEDYENLKHKINVYQNLSRICKELKLENFKSEDFKKLHETCTLNNIFKSQKEICIEELDMVLKNLLIEILTDSYSLDKIIGTKENSQKNLIEAVYSSWNKLNETDQKILLSEFSAIKTFYEYYCQNNFAKAIESVIKRFFILFENTDLKDIVAGKIKSVNELQTLFNSVLEEKPDFESFEEILEWLPQDKSKNNESGKNAVHLSSINADLKEKNNFKYVYVCGLTENNFPGSNTSYPFISIQTNESLNIDLKKQNNCFDYFLKTDDIHFQHRYNSLCDVILHTNRNITFTTHTYESKKTVQPSVFFKILSEYDNENFEKVFEKTTVPKAATSDFSSFNEKYDDSRVISDTDILKLNPSAISTFQKCPRKFFYKNLLNLKEPTTFSASYGNIVHAVFELLNRSYLTSYTKDTALALAQVLFEAKNEDESAQNSLLKAGFKHTDIELIKATDDLSLAEMKDNFTNAIEDFDMMGYFDNPPVNAICEKSFSFTVDELPNVIFDGRIDAILEDPKEGTIIIDYKTGKNKLNSLDYAMSEYGVNFKSKTGKDPSNIETLQKSFDYQIPIYYLACKNSSELSEIKEKIQKLGLLYIRPKTKDNGCFDDFVSAEKIEFYKEKILKNLKETIIDKIVNENEFKPEKTYHCSNCAYNFLCDGGDIDE